MKQKIEELKMEFDKVVNEANSMERIDELRVTFLGKKGKVTELLQGLKDVASEMRRDMGIAINNLKEYVEGLLQNKIQEAKALELQREIPEIKHIIVKLLQ